MKAILISVSVLFSIANSAFASGSFDWPSQLQKNLGEFESGLGSGTKCRRAGYAVSFDQVDEKTIVRAHFSNPVLTDYNPYDAANDLTTDRTPRNYPVEKMTTTICEIGRQATAQAFAFNDQIFRIELTFDRCESRNETPIRFGFSLNGAGTYAKCAGIDLKEQDFDGAMYDAIKARNKYGYSKRYYLGYFDHEWSGYMDNEFSTAEIDYVFDFNCGQRIDIEKLMRNEVYSDEVREIKCLMDIDNADPSHWTATAMYEVVKHGTIVDDIVGRYISKRLFIDIPTEQKVAQSVKDGLEPMVDGIKKQIAERVAAHKSTEDNVSNILGGK